MADAPNTNKKVPILKCPISVCFLASFGKIGLFSANLQSFHQPPWCFQDGQKKKGQTFSQGEDAKSCRCGEGAMVSGHPWAGHPLKHRPMISNPRMQLWICCDEAARLVSSSDTSLSDLIGVVRGSGIGLLLSLQSAEVSRSILSNTPNKFIGRMTNYSDLEVIGSSMGLTREQKHWISKNLVPGMFVGQLGQGNWRHPFVFRIPKMNLKRPEQDHHAGQEATLLRLQR